MAMGFAMSPFAAVKAHAAGNCAQRLQCMTLFAMADSYESRVLDYNGGYFADGDASNAPGVYSYSGIGNTNQTFQFNTIYGDGSFSIISNSTGECLLGATPSSYRTYWFQCDGSMSQRWFIEPSPQGGFMIRSLAPGYNYGCLNVTGGTYNAVFKTQDVGVYSCNSGDNNSRWDVFDSAGVYDSELWDLAAQYGNTLCTPSSGGTNSYCKFVVDSKSAQPASAPCVVTDWPAGPGNVPFNFSYTQSFDESQTTGTVNQTNTQVGVSLTLGNTGFENASPISATFSASFGQMWETNYSRTTGTGSSNAVGFTYTSKANVPAWVDYTPVFQYFNGHFVFDAGSWAQWTYASNSTVTAAQSGSGNATGNYWPDDTSTGHTRPSQSCSSITSPPPPPYTAPRGSIADGSGRCVSDNGSLAGGSVTLGGCTTWNVRNNGEVSSSTTGLCLSTYNGGTGNNTTLTTNTCNGSTSPGITAFWHRLDGSIVNPVSARCVDEYYGGNPLELYDCVGNSNQQFPTFPH
ncbi:hypothetical protein GCM10010442_34350 [Kitasatospora kifunensis]